EALAGTQCHTSILLQGISGDMPPSQRKSLRRIGSSAHHLLALINHILDISRIEAGKMPVHVGEFAIPDLIGEIEAEVEPIVSRTKLALLRDVDPLLPRGETDPAKVKQGLIKFFANARQVTPEGWG